MRLLAAISQHGLGHLAQAAPVLNALRALQPDLQLTIWSGLGRAALQSRIVGPFQHRADAADVGLVMRDAMRVDSAASHAAYLAFHADWPARVSREAAWLRGQAFDRVFADIAYLPLAAAAQAGIAGVAMCSLNWADIARAYLAELPGMTQILAQAHAAYAAADLFLQPDPAMPMEDLPQRRPISPIAAQGRNRRDELNRKLGLPADHKLVLLGFGGIGYQGRGGLPKLDATRWLTSDNWPAEDRPDLIPFSRCDVPFLDLLASCDLLVTKVGYGSFVEANAHALPVLYLDRPDWPETPYLAGWLRQHGNAIAIDETLLFCDALGELMQSLWRQPRKPATPTDGAETAARHLLAGQG
jgi:hypothetical protein